MDAERVVAPRDVLEPVGDTAVVVGVDDLLLLPRAPRMRSRRAERDAGLAGDPEQAVARVLLLCDDLAPALAAPRANLDLRLDQLARHRFGQHRVGLGRGLQLRVSLSQRQAVWVEELELLLHCQREVR